MVKVGALGSAESLSNHVESVLTTVRVRRVDHNSVDNIEEFRRWILTIWELAIFTAVTFVVKMCKLEALKAFKLDHMGI